MTRKILSIIPARGGSKGLPRKNLANLCGRPLIAWTIEASLNSTYITKTVVSSDDKDILDVALGCGAEIIKRPDNIASDEATSESLVKHAIDLLGAAGDFFDIVILLQPTSPLRNSQDVDEAFEIFFDSGASAMISTSEFDNKILKTFTEGSDGLLKGVSSNKYAFTRRQDLPSVYMPNGAIYIINVKSFRKNESFLTSKTLNYIMSKEKSIDVDNLHDLKTIESLILR